MNFAIVNGEFFMFAQRIKNSLSLTTLSSTTVSKEGELYTWMVESARHLPIYYSTNKEDISRTSEYSQ